MRLWIEKERKNRRADIVPAQAKTAANYASPMVAKVRARAAGYDEILLIDEFGARFEADTVKLWSATPSQEKLSQAVDAYRARKFEEQLTCLVDRARFNAARAPNAGAWIHAKPTRPELEMSDDEYRIASCYRYGWAVHTSEYVGICPDCDEQLDPRGLHALHCGNHNNEWTKRHDAIRDRIYFWARKGQFKVEKEKYGLLDGGKKPADVFIYDYRRGATYSLDVAVASPFGAGYLRDAAISQLAAADKKALEKYDKYAEDINGQPWVFQPITFEALGGFSGPSRFCIATIAKRARDHINCPKAVCAQVMSREISVILARGAARLALRRMVPRDYFDAEC